MGLLQLEYFRALAEKEHLTQTAKELLVSAPSLSATIARLEEELECKLFDRCGRNIRLNEYGRVYLKYTNEILELRKNAKKELLDMAKPKNAHLSIGISSPVIWLDAVGEFIRKYPDITVSHSLLKNDQLKNVSYCASFDFIITATSDMLSEDWEYKTLISNDRPIIAVCKSHPLAERSSVRLIETKDEKYIAVSRDCSIRKFFDDSCQMAGFVPRIVLECEYMMRTEMLKAGYGIIFTTESGARANIFQGAAFIPISDQPLRRTQAIFYNRGNYLSRPAQDFIEFMVDYYREFQEESAER